MDQVPPLAQLPDNLVRGFTLGVAAVVASAVCSLPLHTQSSHSSGNQAESVTNGHHMVTTPYPDPILDQAAAKHILMVMILWASSLSISSKFAAQMTQQITYSNRSHVMILPPS